jgi:cytoskeletal protein CcmA (bactofilin family)
MFGKSTETGTPRSQSLVQEGMTIRGDAKVEGDLRLDGVLEGSLLSKAKVTIGATGVVRADIDAAEVLVMGRVTGKITALRRIELRKGAHIEGDLATPALVIEEGVHFQGACQMSSSQQHTSGQNQEGRTPQPKKPGAHGQDAESVVSPPTSTT